MNILKKHVFYALALLLMVWGAGCKTTPLGPGETTAASTATEDSTATPQVRRSPQRVDIRGFITQREYNQGQMLIMVEGTMDQNSRYSRALVLITPLTQIVGLDGKGISMNELYNGQQVAIQFRGRYREGVGFSAQATARKMWIEP